MKNHKYITRRDDTHYLVRIRISTDPKTKERKAVSKCFNFHKYGSAKQALIEAIKWRDRMLTQQHLTGRLKYKKSPDYYSDSKTIPIIGVYETYTISSGKYRYNWTARYQHDGDESKRHFSINKYGDKQAFLKACEYRFNHTGPLKIVNRHLMPCKLPRRLQDG